MPLKTHILRLDSVVPHGVGGPEAGIIDLIYAFLLQEYGQTAYNYIHINQIGDDLNELIIKDGKKIYINLRYPTYTDFEQRSTEEQNCIRLDIAHTALLRIAEQEKKLDKSKLEAIREKILNNSFSFDFVYRAFTNKRKQNLTAKVVVHPQISRFNFYVQVEQDENVVCRLPIYQGKTTDWYFPMFAKGKWKGDKEFSLINKEVEIQVLLTSCRAEIINLTPYDNPPHFQMMKAEQSKEEQEKTYRDWLHSLPPAVTSVVMNNPN